MPKKFVTSHRDTSFYLCSLFTLLWLVEKKRYCAILPVLSVVGRHWHSIWNVETKTQKNSDSSELCFSHEEEMRLYLCQLWSLLLTLRVPGLICCCFSFSSESACPLSEFLIDKSFRGLRTPTYSQITTHICLKWVDAAFLSFVLLFILIISVCFWDVCSLVLFFFLRSCQIWLPLMNPDPDFRSFLNLQKRLLNVFQLGEMIMMN